MEHKCDFMLMHRIEDVRCYGTNKKYYPLYDTKEYLHLVNSKDYPGSSLSSVAIYKKDFLNKFLDLYNNSNKGSRFPISTPNCYEWFSHENVYNIVGDKNFAIPKKAVLQHYEPYDIKERV